MLQTLIFHQKIVPDHLLDQLQENLPAIIADILRVPGGNLALLEARQISLHFIEASRRDVGKNIHVLIYAGLNEPRQTDRTNRANKIREEIFSLIGNEYTVDVRLYLQYIGAAEDINVRQSEPEEDAEQ
jgi:hypothetical protein